MPDLLAPLRNAIRSPLEQAFSADRFPQEQYVDPPGDPGLMGPDSAAWVVHADPAGIVGGISALMLQALHPLAMAGVAEHSDYQERPFARLSRTASFVTVTTYASTAVAEQVIEVVKAVHERVRGVAPDGRPYAASDPELLRWVHVAEVGSILRAHRRYNPVPLRGSDLDRYYADVAPVAERLGATEVPKSRADVRRYLDAVRPELVCDEQARDVMRFLLEPIGTDPVTRTASSVLQRAAVGLLPGWARAQHDVDHPAALELGVIRPTTFWLLGLLRTLGGTPVPVVEARARAASV